MTNRLFFLALIALSIPPLQAPARAAGCRLYPLEADTRDELRDVKRDIQHLNIGPVHLRSCIDDGPETLSIVTSPTLVGEKVCFFDELYLARSTEGRFHFPTADDDGKAITWMIRTDRDCPPIIDRNYVRTSGVTVGQFDLLSHMLDEVLKSTSAFDRVFVGRGTSDAIAAIHEAIAAASTFRVVDLRLTRGTNAVRSGPLYQVTVSASRGRYIGYSAHLDMDEQGLKLFSIGTVVQ